MEAKFTIFFEDPFWIGIVELYDGSVIKIGKHVFGPEPGDAVIHDFSLRLYQHITLDETGRDARPFKPVNPKRMQRMVIKEQKKRGISTKSQEAVKKIYEEKKRERKKNNTLKKYELRESKYERKVLKLKQKKKGH